MRIIRKILFTFVSFTFLVAHLMGAEHAPAFTLENIHGYCSMQLLTLVAHEKISTNQAGEYLKRFKNEVFYAPVEIETINSHSHKKEIKKGLAIQDIIAKKLLEILHTKPKTTMYRLVQAVLCELFGKDNLAPESKGVIIQTIGIEAEDSLRLTVRNYSKVLWNLVRVISNIYISMWHSTDTYLQKFSKEVLKNEYRSSQETKFVDDFFKHPRINALMRDDIATCFLFVMQQDELVEMVKTLLLMIKVSLPSGLCNKGDEEPADIAGRFDCLKITSQSMIDEALAYAAPALKEGKSLAAFYAMLLHCLWEYYKKQ